MICNTVIRNICMKRKNWKNDLFLYHAMNLLNLLRMTTYFMHCLVPVALGFCQLELWQQSFPLQSLHMEIGMLLTNDVFLYLPPLLCPDDGHKYEGWAEVSRDWNRWITGLNKCIEFQSVAPCGKYLCAVNQPHCALDLTFKILHLHTSMRRI